MRHHIRKRTVFFDFSNVRGKPAIDVSKLTGKRETFTQYSDGSSKKIVDEDFKKRPIRSRIDPKEWTGTTTFFFTPKVRQKRKAPIIVKKPRSVPKKPHEQPAVQWSLLSEHVTSEGSKMKIQS